MKLAILTLLLLHGSFNIPAGDGFETIPELLRQAGIRDGMYASAARPFWPATHAFRCQDCTLLQASCAMLKDTGFELPEYTFSWREPLLELNYVGILSMPEPVVENPCHEPKSGYRQFDIPSMTVTAALKRWARIAGIELQIDPEVATLTRGMRSTEISESMPPPEALPILLAGAGVELKHLNAANALRVSVSELVLPPPEYETTNASIIVPLHRPRRASPRPAPPRVREPLNQPTDACVCEIIRDPIGPFDVPTGSCIEADGSRRWMPSACRLP